ncbi:MAG: DUF302 domain-containing protein [Rhizobiaceae bacterium]
MPLPTKQILRSLAGATLASLLMMATSFQAQASEITEYVVEAPFEDVRQDLGDGVVSLGYKVDHESFIGDMLARTSADVGGKKSIFKKAELIQFCSAVLSRAAMEADPANIAFCPYILFAYERTDEPGKVHVGFRRLDETGSEASKKALAKINSVLDGIAKEAANQ